VSKSMKTLLGPKSQPHPLVILPTAVNICQYPARRLSWPDIFFPTAAGSPWIARGGQPSTWPPIPGAASCTPQTCFYTD